MADPTITQKPSLTQTKEPNATKEPTATRGPTATKVPETLTSPKGDGIYAIGIGIQSGLWRSQGSTEDYCYWELLDQNLGIIKNNAGRPGGSVNLPADAYEFRTDGCGEWIYIEGIERVPRPDIMQPKGDGYYIVGVDISIGTWESQGTGSLCLWELTDQNQENIRFGMGPAGGAATITEDSYEFYTTGCGEWILVQGLIREPNADIDEPKGDGYYTVGVEISPGTWESQGNDDLCFWERRDMYQNIIDNYLGKAGGSVTIQPTDFEFHAIDCGEWIKR
jgi:hypothetical protein